ncbi:glycosyltransferase family 4 protein [Variovorax sp. J22R115]|uniref:glycosyltransferase family 4 protein n=1 Tax=Variovorax sp. J22R115 TaxID=3053509 RepID=UPI0025751154|nr:glycosyltransferase [Variovorax sp. J22R115]MDM0053467.1 glycosyltransferase [Variovorax sp. J22R115]
MYVDFVMISRLGLSDGGRETWLRNFLREAGRQRADYKFNLHTLSKDKVNVLTLVDSANLGSVKEIGCNRGLLPISIVFVLKFGLNGLLKKKAADHVVAIGGLDEALAVVFSYLLRPVNGRRILWLRTIYTKEKAYRLSKVARLILLKFEIFVVKNFFDLVIANGEDTAEFYRGLGVDCIVINNGIEIERWDKISISPSKRTRIAFIGRLAEVKGIKSFFTSVEMLASEPRFKEFEFHVVGDGPFREEAERLQSGGLLKYHGALANDAIPAFVANMDCCVALTFLTDSIGGGGVSNALVEQMAAGQAIVAWDNGIFRKTLTQGSAYFVPQGNVEQLVQSYLNIRANPEVAKLKSEMAKAASKGYSIVNHVRKFFNSLEGSAKVDS